jgi:hypothetical protein
MKSLIPYLLIIALLAGCSKDDDPAGPAGALKKPFNLVMSGLGSTIAYKLMVSPDGTKVLAGIANEVNPVYQYSKDGGATFSPVGEVLNRNLRYASEISSNGLVLTSQNQVFQMEGGAQVTISGGETVILGDKGKVFVYHHNTATLSQKNSNESTFQPVTKPIEASPGSAASYYAIKVPGKGVAFVVSPINRSDKTVSVHILDETTMIWTSHSAPLTHANINGCNNLSQFERFTFGSNNTLIMKGCSGTALLDLTAGTTKYVAYPALTNAIPESFRDGMTLMDNKGGLYVTTGVYGETFFRIHQFKDNKWELVSDNLEGSSVMAMDNNGTFYYNSGKAEGTVMRSPVKVNTQTNAKTLLGLPRSQELIFDAIALSDEVILVCNGQLFRYDISGSVLTNFGLREITHFNVLSDGRWVAGGADLIHLSTDEGGTWTKTDKLFSPSLTQFQAGMYVSETRIVNGQLLIVGTSTTYYQNLTLGLTQTKHDNMIVDLNGAKQNYQMPTDLDPSVLGPDGTLYGTAEFVSEFGNLIDLYEIKPGVSATRLEIKKGPIPQVITDEGLQMTLGGSKSGSGYDVFTRKSIDGEWESAGDLLPNTATVRAGQKLRAGGDGVTFINGTEVYAAGN